MDLRDPVGGWRSGPVLVAASFRDRRRGLAPAPDGVGLLVATRSVHSLTMRVALGIALIDTAGTVLHVTRLDSGRVLLTGSAGWILETIPGESLPVPGRRLVVVPMLAGCLES